MYAKRILPLALLLCHTAAAGAHPFTDIGHYRTITVRFKDAPTAGHVLVEIDYILELSESRAADDAKKYTEIDPALFAGQAHEFYTQFAAAYAEIIAANLRAELNRAPLVLKEDAAARRQTLTDEKGQSLGHARCTFRYQTEFAVAEGDNVFRLLEQNYRSDSPQGQIYLSFINEASIKLTKPIEPDPVLVNTQTGDGLVVGDERLRELIVHFITSTERPQPEDVSIAPAAPKTAEHDRFLQTFRKVRESKVGLGLMLLAFAGLGAAHALTPGHGKTLVAAYLVGSHGTVWHALVLGLVTTLTHTGVVLAFAAILFFVPANQQAIQTGMGLGLGLLVTCGGFWLLLKRLTGGADHVHISSASRERQRPEHGAGSRLGWLAIIVLGITGGLIPCWDAVAILMMVIGTGEFWLALPALLAFSAGLAGVLVLIGILVVQFRNFAGSHWGEGRIVRSLPIVSAVLVAAMGLYLCYESVHGR